MWDPDLPIPEEFQVIMEESDSEEEMNSGSDEDHLGEEEYLENEEYLEEEVEVNEDVDMIENIPIAVSELPIYVQAEDGSLVQLEAEELGYYDAESEDEEIRLAREDLLRCISPIDAQPGSSSSEPHPQRAAAKDQSPRILVKEQLNGSAGRGRSRRGARFRADGQWMRGQPLVERYPQDDDLPEQTRSEIKQLLSDRRSRNARQSRTAENDREAAIDEDEEEFENAEEFVWRPMSEWRGVKESFLPRKIGPTKRFKNAYDTFRAFWDDNILSHIARETNNYAAAGRLVDGAKTTFRRDWYETNVHELLLLFAFWMMLGMVRMPTIKSCFSENPLLQTRVFRMIFKEQRYWNLNAALQFADNSKAVPGDVLYPIRPAVDHLNKKFKEHYNLSQNICVDESLTLWKGPESFKQYLRFKSAKFGIKSYQLCESTTGYMWSFFIYVGRGARSVLPASASYVLKLVKPLLGLGHTLFIDNWFNSPLLARFLKKRRTDCVGTLRLTRKNVPLEIQRANLKEGEFIARQAGDVMVVSLQDRKRVTLISTYHDTTQSPTAPTATRPSQYKFDLVNDYNHMMGGVDRLDQMLEPYLIERKQCINWTRKLFKRLLNISIQNTRILIERSTNTKLDSLAFRLALVEQILERHLSEKPEQLSKRLYPARILKHCHFIRAIPIKEEDIARNSSRHRTNMGRIPCVWCKQRKNIKKKTRYYCPDCNVPLCLQNCFAEYHTIV